MTLAGIRDNHAYNLATFKRQPLRELSGAVGDLGTFLPLLIALAKNGTVSLPSTLVFSGLFNVATGVLFGIPLPVQPMKAVAAAAIASNFSPEEIAGAGMFVGGCVMLFSVTGLLRWFSNSVPIPVVKGIQVGAGLSLVISAGTNMKTSLGWRHPWFDNYLWVTAAFFGLLVTNVYRKVSYGLLLFTICLVFAFGRVMASNESPSFSIWLPTSSAIVIPSWSSWKIGIVNAGLGQLPLTTLNSVLAVVYLAAELLPTRESSSVTTIGISVGAMNLLGCWFGAMPVCHGSGGLAAQYHFGARSGASIIVLGLAKVAVGILFGNTILSLLREFPTSLLGVMVMAAGLQLTNVGESLNTLRAWDLAERQRRQGSALPRHAEQAADGQLGTEERKQRWNIMFATLSMLLAFKNDGIGFLAGMACHWVYRISTIIEAVRVQMTRGRIALPEDEGDREGN